MNLTRRELVKLGLGAAALSTLPRILAQTAGPAPAATAPAPTGPVNLKTIPSSGEKVPPVGIGTRTYTPNGAELAGRVNQVVKGLPELGGKVIDTAAGYGESEVMIGNALAAAGNRNSVFLATKMSRGKDEAEACFQRLKTDKIDLIAVWNLNNTDANLGILKEMKAAGRIKYIGVTTSSENQYGQLETIMKAQPLDFIQVDYALDNREAADRIFPLALERKMGVMINLPFGRTRLFQAVGTRPLPDWAKEIDCTSWAQVFLKYIVAHPAVTVAIPGTTRLEHLTDNMQANRGRLPDEPMRKRMEQFIDAL